MARWRAGAAVLVAFSVAPVSAAPGGGAFVDDDGMRVEAYAEALAAEDVVRGCDADHLCPTANVTRGQLASLLARARAVPPTHRDFFNDDNGTVHEDAINRLAAAGLASGRSPGRFDPDRPVSRGQAASLIVSAFGVPLSPTDTFDDDNGTVHESRINAGRADSILEPCAAGPHAFCPSSPMSRQDLVIFISKAMGLPPRPPQSSGRMQEVGRPIYFGHRGEASRYPENTMEGFAEAVADGVRAMEFDVQLLSDGSFGVMHDTTIDRTTTSTGPVGQQTMATWRELIIDVAPFQSAFGPPQTLHPPMLDDVIAAYGNRVLLLPEAKNYGSGQGIADALLRHGVHPDAALVLSFGINELRPASNAGYPTMLATDSASPSSMVAAGVDWVAVTPSASPAYTDSVRAAGLHLAVWTINDRGGRDAALARGAEGIMTDDPIGLARS